MQKRELNLSVTKRIRGKEIQEATDGFIFDFIMDVTAVTTMESQAESAIYNICVNKGITQKRKSILRLYDAKEMKKMRVNLYSTGLTSALIASINACYSLGIMDINVFHYDRKTESYYRQKVA